MHSIVSLRAASASPLCPRCQHHPHSRPRNINHCGLRSGRETRNSGGIIGCAVGMRSQRRYLSRRKRAPPKLSAAVSKAIQTARRRRCLICMLGHDMRPWTGAPDYPAPRDAEISLSAAKCSKPYACRKQLRTRL